MIFPFIVYILIGLAITSFMFGYIDYDDSDGGVFLIAVIAWPIILIVALIILYVNLFHWLGELLRRIKE